MEFEEWLSANIDAVVCDYGVLVRIFERCVRRPIACTSQKWVMRKA